MVRFEPHIGVLLTHGGRAVYKSVNLAVYDSDNGLAPVLHQPINRANSSVLSIGLLGTYFNEIWIKIQRNSYKGMNLKRWSAKRRPFLCHHKLVYKIPTYCASIGCPHKRLFLTTVNQNTYNTSLLANRWSRLWLLYEHNLIIGIFVMNLRTLYQFITHIRTRITNYVSGSQCQGSNPEGYG